MEFKSLGNQLMEYVDSLTEDLRKCMPTGMDISMWDIHLKSWDIIITYKIYCDEDEIENNEKMFDSVYLKMNLRFIEIYRDDFINLIKKIVSGDSSPFDNAVNIIKENAFDKDIFIYFDIVDCYGNLLMDYNSYINSILNGK